MRNVRFNCAQIRSWNADRHHFYYRIDGESHARYRSIYADNRADAEHRLFLENDRRGREIAEIF